MQRNNVIRSLGLLGLILLFALGVFQLFESGFKSGEIYPAYSSLRSDPLGTRALYESLKNLKHITVRRNYRPLKFVTPGPKTTLLYLGASKSNWHLIPIELMDILDRLIHAGGSLVLAFLPTHQTPIKLEGQECSGNQGNDSGLARLLSAAALHASDRADPFETEKSSTKKSVLPETNPSKPTQKEPEKKFVSIKQRWGVSLEFKASAEDKQGNTLNRPAISQHADLPEVISWHTNLYFQIFDPDWKVLYASDGYPAVIERAHGQGSIILCADSFIFSNEALWAERHPQLLYRLIGRNSHIVFDESHLGLYKRPGVAHLIRHYRFHWFFAALGLLAILFVWRNKVYFVPPEEDGVAVDNTVISTKDSTQGLITLLRRNIPYTAIMAVCVREWKQTSRNERRIPPATIERITHVLGKEENLAKRQTDPVKIYHSIRRIISKDKPDE